MYKNEKERKNAKQKKHKTLTSPNMPPKKCKVLTLKKKWKIVGWKTNKQTNKHTQKYKDLLSVVTVN